jgi:hypothetical protein
MTVYSALTDEESYLWAILSDESGLDQAEFAFTDETQEDGCFRAWPFQWPWWRCSDQLQIDRASRSVGKSLSIKMRAFAFPFVNPGEEMVITAPEGVHLDAVTDNVETLFLNTRLAREMISRGRGGIKHRPFMINFANGARIMGRIPQRDGKGVKGSTFDTLTMTRDRGLVPVQDIKVGDYVWTHEKRWGKVLDTYTIRQEGYSVKGQGAFEMDVSADHRFYARNDISKQPGKTKRELGEFTWEWPDNFTESKYMPVNVYWTGCTDFGDPLPIPEIDYSSCKTSFEMNEDFWWVVGRYLADGSGSGSSISLFVHPKDQSEIIVRLDRMMASYSIRARKHSSADNVCLQNAALNDWLRQHFGHHSHHKEIPTWCYTMPVEWRQALLGGYLSGDGAAHIHHGQHRDNIGSASKKLTLGLGTLATTLGYNVGYGVSEINVTEVMGVPIKEKAADSYRCRLTKSGHGVWDKEGFVSYKIKTAEPIPEQTFYGLVVDGGSYWADGVMHKNTHPIWLEMDEASDWPEQAWAEIIETVKIQNPKARWRAHGVTRGVGGGFDERCQPDSGWKVHALPAMLRPNWTEQERQSKIKEYGGHVDAVDYRRNVLGLPGDQNSPIFVLYRLMEVVDTDLSSDYNSLEYVSLDIDESMVRDVSDIAQLLDMPGSHMKYKHFWIGMDVGWTLAPSSIVVFAEEAGKKGGPSTLRLIAKILLKKVSTIDQTSAIIHLIDMYRPRQFALDSTGAGFPLLQGVQEAARRIPELKHTVPRIRGFNFSEKVIAEFDDSIEINQIDPDGWKEAAIKRSVLEWSTDVLRKLVDEKRLLLPYDKSIIGEFQGQTWTYTKSALDAYGRKKLYSAGAFHTLDACRMAALAYQQDSIDAFIKSKESSWEPPQMVFI